MSMKVVYEMRFVTALTVLSNVVIFFNNVRFDHFNFHLFFHRHIRLPTSLSIDNGGDKEQIMTEFGRKSEIPTRLLAPFRH